MKRELKAEKSESGIPITIGYLKEYMDGKFSNMEVFIDRKLEEKLDQKLDGKLEEKLDKILEEKLEAKLNEKLKLYPTKAYLEYELGLIKNEINEIKEKLDYYIDDVLTYKDYLAKFMNDFHQEMLFLGNRVDIHDAKIDDHAGRITIIEDKLVLRDGPMEKTRKPKA